MTLALFSKQRGFGGLESLPAAQNRARIPFPSLRCASAIQIVRPLQSIPETQLQLQPGSRGLSAMISNTSGVYDSKGAGQSFSVRTSTGMTSQSARISKIAKCACLDEGIFHQRLVDRRDAKATKSSENNAVCTGSIPVNSSALSRANSKTWGFEPQRLSNG